MLSTKYIRSSLSKITSLLILILSLSSCGHFVARELSGTDAPALENYSFLGEKYPCYLELKKYEQAIRVNCFHIDGVLHIHSSRWSNLPRLSGESWSTAIILQPKVRVEIDEKIYSLTASWVEDENRRRDILHNRGYIHAWDGIKVFRFTAPSRDA